MRVKFVLQFTIYSVFCQISVVNRCAECIQVNTYSGVLLSQTNEMFIKTEKRYVMVFFSSNRCQTDQCRCQLKWLFTPDRVTVYPNKYAHGYCFAVLCCGYTLTDFPISIRLTSLALWQSNDCPSASKATLMKWINTSCEFIMNDCITTTMQSTTKPCAYFLGYTVIKGWYLPVFFV